MNVKTRRNIGFGHPGFGWPIVPLQRDAHHVLGLGYFSHGEAVAHAATGCVNGERATTAGSGVFASILPGTG
ncbi:hypothetical protein G4G27_06905 [Sphingomonas sp. So64.6b]|uniref:hypothetical protein n=1 Tax=Sphingomonas sp. So64.6b TaxID=2997354 RepID=UPI001601237C|nr:hypothetical protein [Sphingomonas sp. So64.6b]QNA83748.1 hypothetical protein G4G27_06905 [Sphingomonas sp. So64.6b]